MPRNGQYAHLSCVSAKYLCVTLAFVFCSWYNLFVVAVKERIREARTAADMTQAELARAVGVTLRTVQNWESGARGAWRYLAEIADATGVPLTFFFENGGNGSERAAA